MAPLNPPMRLIKTRVVDILMKSCGDADKADIILTVPCALCLQNNNNKNYSDYRTSGC